MTKKLYIVMRKSVDYDDSDYFFAGEEEGTGLPEKAYSSRAAAKTAVDELNKKAKEDWEGESFREMDDYPNDDLSLEDLDFYTIVEIEAE